MSSAQLDPRHGLQPEDPEGDSAFALTEYPALKEEVAARLAAHRARRQRSAPAAPAPIPIVTSPARARAAKIAATVAERYAQSASYREFLAAEAETAIRQAEAAAQVAAVTARAVAEAQLNLLEELDQYKQDTAPAAPEPSRPEPVFTLVSPAPAPTPAPRFELEPERQKAPSQPAAASSQRVTVRLYEPAAPGLPPAFTASQLHTNAEPANALNCYDDEALSLDEEIAFRQSPTFEDATAPSEIPANLIEFPRQLVAARRARPRLAEGPLREDAGHESNSAQLRIFEVEPAQISSVPATAAAAPEWTSILLDAQPVIAPTMVQAEEPATLRFNAPPVLLTAPLELRIMAAAVDSAIILSAMLAFAAVAAFTIGSIPELQVEPIAGPAGLTQFFAPLGAVAFIFIFLATVYQCLFFTFSEATPGMRYARIGLCTFADENPTRAQMRRRIPATLLAAVPLGLGLIWSWIDTDRIGWHDRLSRTYQRSY